MVRNARTFVIALLFLVAVAQGLALVTFPAASAILTSPTGFHLSSAQYGGLFVPQVVLAILASGLGPRLARRLGLRGVLLLGLAGDIVSMALLSSSALFVDSGGVFALLCVATGALGLGFGATVMSLNTMIEDLFPDSANGAVLALNALLGLGTALAPLLVTLFNGLGVWWALPLLTAVLVAFLFLAIAGFPAPPAAAQPAAASQGGRSPRFFLYAAAALLYGMVETIPGNWAIPYLSSQRGLSMQEASLALTAFWATVTIGRMIFALLQRWLSVRAVYVILPLALAVVFQFIAHARGAGAGVAGFGAAGLACSALLPLSISLGGTEFPRRAVMMSGELIAFYQIGYGVAAFGVGPLHDFADLPFSTVFSMGSFGALALAFFAWRVARVIQASTSTS